MCNKDTGGAYDLIMFLDILQQRPEGEKKSQIILWPKHSLKTEPVRHAYLPSTHIPLFHFLLLEGIVSYYKACADQCLIAVEKEEER